MMKWMKMMGILPLGLGLCGCANPGLGLPWEPPSPFREGYRAGCAARLDSDASRRDRVPGGSQDAWSRGWVEGYSVCRKPESGYRWKSPYEVEQDQKKRCNEKHRLCYR